MDEDEEPLSDVERAMVAFWLRGAAFDGLNFVAPSISATVLRRYLIGADPEFAVPPGRLVLRNVVVTGQLDLSYILPGSLPGGALPALLFERCEFERAVLINKSSILSLTMRGCAVPQLSLMNSRIDGDLDLTGSVLGREEGGRPALRGEGLVVGGRVALGKIPDGSRFETHGSVRFLGARIGGNLEGAGACLRSGSTSTGSLVLDGAQVEGSVFLRSSPTRRFEALGRIQMSGTTVGGDLNMMGADLNGAGGPALSCHRATVLGRILLCEDADGGRPFRARGCLKLSAVAAGSVDIVGARLGPDAAGMTLDLQRANVASTLLMRDLRRIERPHPEPGRATDREESALSSYSDRGSVDGRFDLSDATVGILDDDPAASWPAQGCLILDGFAYRRIAFHESEAGKADERLRWLDLQYSEPPGPHKFRPQPFEQLARVLRDHGYSQDADAVAMRKRDWAIRCRTEKGVNRWLTKVMQITSGHGYRRRSAIAWTAGWWALGLALISAGENSGVIVFRAAQPEPPASASIVDGRSGGPARPVRLIFDRGPDACDTLWEPVYALELMLPAVEFGQVSGCEMKARRGLNWAVVMTQTLYKVIGVMLVTVLGVTLTGLLRKD